MRQVENLKKKCTQLQTRRSQKVCHNTTLLWDKWKLSGPTASIYCQHSSKLQLQDLQLHEHMPVACRQMDLSLLKAVSSTDPCPRIVAFQERKGNVITKK